MNDGGTRDTGWPRRRVLAAISTVGVGSALFGRALTTLAAGKDKVSPGMIKDAEWIAGLAFTSDDRKMMLDGVNEALRDYAKMRAVPLDNAVPPALFFDPEPGRRGAPPAAVQRDVKLPEKGTPRRPTWGDEVAFLPVRQLAPLLRSKQTSSVELTRLYLERLQRYDPMLSCVVTLTQDMALRQAEQADKEISAGKYRGPLHGIPWGVKDLLAVAGTPTTWGSAIYKDQISEASSTVAERLEKAGAVLLAKLSVGELAWGDVWFGGVTKNPWK